MGGVIVGDNVCLGVVWICSLLPCPESPLVDDLWGGICDD